MKEKLYQAMNWARIEGVVYSEEDKPYEFLGAKAYKNGTLYQAFFPQAKKAAVVMKETGKRSLMEQADEEGFFAALVAGKPGKDYYYEVTDEKKQVVQVEDPYAYLYEPKAEEIEEFRNGTHYELYRFLGSRQETLDGTEGVGFAVWAPGAMRVSLVGEFNHWDGRIYPMNRFENTDIFTLFLPGFTAGTAYQYEIKDRRGNVVLCNDAFAKAFTAGENPISKTTEHPAHAWKDALWMKKRAKQNPKELPLSVYPASAEVVKIGNEFIERIKKAGFTHVSLEDLTGARGSYCLGETFAGEEEVKNFVEAAHAAELGVLFQWNAKIEGYLGTREVSNFYIANIFYWLEEYHLDGAILSELASILYLDYGKQPGEWSPNMYGGNENLEAVEFIKHSNSMAVKRNPGVLLIADLDAIWPQVTEDLEEGGLGFHYRFDTDFTKGFLDYLKADPYFRSGLHEKITERMIYAYCERFLMAFPKKDTKNLWEEISGETEDKFRTLKAAFAYISLLPGKSMAGFELPEAEAGKRAAFLTMASDCHKLLSEQTALKDTDYDNDNFSWINCFQSNDCTVSFLRKTEALEDSLLVVANFANACKEEFTIGVPFEGKYKVIFDSESKLYGGELSKEQGVPKENTLCSEEKEWDGFSQAVTLPLAPLNVVALEYIPYTEEELLAIADKKAECIRIQLEEEARAKAEKMKKAKKPAAKAKGAGKKKKG